MADEGRNVCDGTLTVHLSGNGDVHTVAFSGELDLANARTAEAELGAALAMGEGKVILDLRALEFIDSTGIALLVATLRRDGASRRLVCIPSKAPAVTRVLQLTGVEAKLPLGEPSADGEVATPG